MSKSQNPTKEVIPIMKKRIYRRMPVNDFQPCCEPEHCGLLRAQVQHARNCEGFGTSATVALSLGWCDHDPCLQPPAAGPMTTGCAISSARSATPTCSNTSAFRAPRPPVGFTVGLVPSFPPRLSPWTRRSFKASSSHSGDESGSSWPSSDWPSSSCGCPVFVSTRNVSPTEEPNTRSWQPSLLSRRPCLWLSPCAYCDSRRLASTPGATWPTTARSMIGRAAIPPSPAKRRTKCTLAVVIKSLPILLPAVRAPEVLG
jgi:hypothetical protein